MLRPRASLLLICLLAHQTGCAWYIVESSYSGDRRLPPPKVTHAPDEGSAGRDRLTVALQAPDSCADNVVGKGPTGINPDWEFLGSDCAVELAQLERALVAQGYRVVSWSAIHEMGKGEKPLTPLEAAARLKANVVFQVNSLGIKPVARGPDEKWTRQFYRSSSTGTKGLRINVTEVRARDLELLAKQNEKVRVPPSTLMGVSLNATAVAVDSGEAFWFYEWTGVQPADLSPVVSFLARCGIEDYMPCEDRSRRPRRGRSGGTELLPTDDLAPQQKAEETYLDLVDIVVDDLIRSFRERRQARR
jgi:hypothetical protein